jgi:hypothetical protein
MPEVNFLVKKGLTVPKGSASTPAVIFDASDSNTGLYSPGADQVAISTNGTGRLFVDASGRILAGTSSARVNFFNTTSLSASLQIEGATSSSHYISFISSNSTGNEPACLILGHQKSGSIGGNTLLGSGDATGRISFQGSDGAQFVEAAAISCDIDGTPSGDDMPGRLVFATTAHGAASPTERMRLDSSGRLGLGTSSVSNPFTLVATTGLTNDSDLPSASALIKDSASGRRLGAGTSSTGNWIQSSYPGVDGVAYNLLLNPLGGRVGIGVTGAQRLLHLHQSADTSIKLTNGTTGTGTTDGLDITMGGGDGVTAYITNREAGATVFENNGSERARLTSDGKWLVGTSTSTGLNSNTAPVIAGNFASFTGSVSTTTGTATTLFALENLNASYIVTAMITGTVDAANYSAVYMVASVSSASCVIQAIRAGGLLTLSLSGANVQVTQSSGVNQTVSWSVTRMANL